MLAKSLNTPSHPPSPSISTRLSRVSFRRGPLSPLSGGSRLSPRLPTSGHPYPQLPSSSHPSPLLPGSPLRGHVHPHPHPHPHRRAHAQNHFSASVPARHLPNYDSYPDSVPSSPPGPPHPNRPPSGPYQSAMTMPNKPLPNPFGSPAAETLPAYSSQALPNTYHGDALPRSSSISRGSSLISPQIRTPRSHRSYSSTTPRSAVFTRSVPVNHDHHDEANRLHHISGTVSKFFISSFEYTQHPFYPIHPAFADWIDNLGPEALALVWRLTSENILLPVVIVSEYVSKANVQNFHLGARLEYLHVSANGMTFSKEYMGDICIREEWHLVHKNIPLLMFAQPLNPRLMPIRGLMFAHKEGDKKKDRKYPSLTNPNVQLLTHGFRENKVENSSWGICHDNVIEIREKQGHGEKVGIITPESSIHGYICTGPIVWEEGSKHPELWKNGFLTHVILGLIVFPLDRPANMTRLLKWLHQLGPLAAEG